MMITYGYQVTNSDDDFILAAEETSKITGRAMAPGRWMVESLPWCAYGDMGTIKITIRWLTSIQCAFYQRGFLVQGLSDRP